MTVEEEIQRARKKLVGHGKNHVEPAIFERYAAKYQDKAKQA